jgi:coenzyme F420 hydrogenase subunit beta
MTAPLSPTLAKVLKGQLCTGCGLCAGVSSGAIDMVIDAAGYARPLQNVPLEPAAEAMIAAACPGKTVAPWPRDAGEDMQWGPHREVMTGYAIDSALRQSASSGGGISALAIHALQAGLVDAVVQTGVDPADPTRTATRISDSTETVAASVGSRYGPSSPLSGITTLLEDSRRFAFIGKPCDVSALRSLAKVDARVNERFPIMLSFFCAGIPSLKGTDQILADLGVARADLSDFKYRGDGWPGYATATRHDGSAERMSYEDSWGGRLSKVVQFRCKICPDAVGGSADVACADAWYGDENGYPTFEETDGRSLMITRTAAGKALVDAARAKGIVATEPVPIRDIDKMQPSQARRKRLIASRLAAMAVTFQPLLAPKGVGIAATARTAGVGETVKSFLGLIRRIVQGRK